MTGTLPGIFDGYLDLYWRTHPVEATHAGRHELDAMYPRFDAESVREQIAALTSYTLVLEEADADALAEEIDRTAVLQDARHQLLILERERPFASNPAFHLTLALSGIHLLLARNAEDPPRRAAALLERLRALPDFLASAAQVLTEPARPLVALASAMVPGGLSLIRTGLDDVAVDLSSLDPGELSAARDAAAAALTAFSDELVLLEETARDGGFAIGRDLFDRKLHTAHLIRENADELLRYGERLREEALADVTRIAGEIRPGVPWLDVIATLREDAPSREHVLDEYEAALRSARDFVAARGLMHVPDADLRVTPTPHFLRALVPFAAYQGPGAFDSAQVGQFYVTLPNGDASWRPMARAELRSTVVHEAVPGHHVQVSTSNRLPSVVRRVLSTPAAREGWALYSETLMAESGFFPSRAEALFHAYNLLWRAIRIILDVSLHTKGMTVAAAGRRLMDELGFPAGQAAAEVMRYCAYPTYQLCYGVGRRDVLRLRDDARRARGDSFALAEFHDELLSYGALPTALARWGMGLGR
ncbi:MAG TPA: DUF885 domain-containing protein [Gemmatimonadaceae bacterium]|nr:DUF885 domain-containing protein [Gemmatimonadaceae bacterium]